MKGERLGREFGLNYKGWLVQGGTLEEFISQKLKQFYRITWGTALFVLVSGYVF